MGILLALRRGLREKVIDSMTKCSEFLGDDLKRMMFFPFLGNVQEVGQYLKVNGLNLKERLRTQSKFTRRKSILKSKEEIMEIIDLLKNEKEIVSPLKRDHLLKKITRIRVSLWKRVFSLYIAIKAENEPWASSLKRSLAKESPYFNILMSLPFDDSEQLKIRDFLVDLLSLYRSEYEDTVGLKILAERLTRYGEKAEFRLLRTKFDADWSLTELRSNFKNPVLKREFFDFWFQVMMNRTSENEIKEHLRSTLDSRVLKSSEDSQFWIFEFFFPADKELRKIITKRLLEMWNSYQIEKKFIVLKAMEKSEVKTSLIALDPQFKRADFQYKREFYTDLLNSGYSTEYSLYSLYQIGDRQEENLWWLMF